MKLRHFFLILQLVATSFLWAVVPNGYYTNANNKNTSTLRTSLQAIITNGHSVTSYNGLWTAYSTTDINPSTGKIWDMYSNCEFTLSTNQCGTYSAECDCYNREHSTPQSWFASASPMVSDLYNVYPTDGKVNGMRNNYPYGEVGSVTYTSANGCKLGSSSILDYSGVVFEPIDEYKGDLARTYFYMATRYATQCETWNSGAEIVYGANLGFTTYSMNLFLKWSRQDPVSSKEIARNDAVYGIQNNRNPFIDYPGIEEYIWGNNTSRLFTTSVVVTAPTIITPTATSITSNSATLGANITSKGNGTITESGIYYSTTNGFANGTGTKVTASATEIGTFTKVITNLFPNTTYYFKGFATNSAGTSYTSQATFTTLTDNNPKINTGNEISSGSTLSFGNVSGAVTKSLYIKTNYIIGDLTVGISGTMFSVNTTTILQSDAENGYNLRVTYNPTSSGSHTGSISITGGGLSGYTINLSGTK